MELFIENKRFDGIQFQIGDNKKIISHQDMGLLLDILSDFHRGNKVLVQLFNQYKNWYQDLDGAIQDFMNNGQHIVAHYEDDDAVYCIGDDYIIFLEQYGVENNNQAGEYLKREYIKEFGYLGDITFDPDNSYCYIYVDNKEDTEQFLRWVHQKVIFPFLELQGIQEFLKGE